MKQTLFVSKAFFCSTIFANLSTNRHLHQINDLFETKEYGCYVLLLQTDFVACDVGSGMPRSESTDFSCLIVNDESNCKIS
jgi:hypothetical protein